jgi:hypothetical protein
MCFAPKLWEIAVTLIGLSEFIVTQLRAVVTE